jgi:hypothetical protein
MVGTAGVDIKAFGATEKAMTAVEKLTYTVREFSIAAGWSERHTWRHLDSIPGVIRLGKTVRISKAIADKFLAEGGGK